MNRTYEVDYKGERGLCLENEAIKAVFLPGQGAKLCSLVRKGNGKEYIYQGRSKTYRRGEYGQSYLEGECAGVDEMFPTIDACYYECPPWQGTHFPDHGELWALPWDCSMDSGKQEMSVYGVKLPYHLSKTVTLSGERVHIDYELENLSGFPMDYIWAAHMMFRAEEGACFEFDRGLKKAYTTMSDSGTIGKYADTFEYPYVEREDGSRYDIRIHRGEKADDYQKFYFAQKLAEGQGWGRICYPDHTRLTVSFPAEEIPYLGAVQGEGGSLNLKCMFIEPCTGAFDNPASARMHGMYSVLKPKEKKGWYLDIEITERRESI